MKDDIHYSKEVAKGSLWGLAGSAVFYLASFFYVVLIARAVSQDDIGTFFLALSVVSAGAILDNLGLSSAISRYIPYFEGKGEQGKIRSLLKVSYGIVTILSLLLFAVLWLLSDMIGAIYQNMALAEAIRMLSAFLLFSNILNMNVAYLRGRADIKRMQLSANSQNFLKLALTAIFFIAFGPTIWAMIGAFILSFVLSVFVSSFFVVGDMRGIQVGGADLPAMEVMMEILPFGIMVGLVQSLGAIFISANRLILGYLVDPAQSAQVIAIYTFAATLAAVIMAFPTSIGHIFMPMMARLYGEGKLDRMRAVTETAQRWSLFIMIPVGLVMVAFSGDILAVVYGESYRSGGLVMSILTIGFLLSGISFMLSLTLIAMRLVTVQLKIVLASGLLNVLGTILLIPVLGMEGSAIASLIGFSSSVLLLSRYANRHFGFRMPSAVYKLSLAGSISFAIMLALGPLAGGILPSADGSYISRIISLVFLGLLSAFSMGMFALISLMLRCFKPEDRTLLARAMRKAGAPDGIISLMERISSYGISA